VPTVSRLVRIQKTVREKVISKSRFYSSKTCGLESVSSLFTQCCLTTGVNTLSNLTLNCG